MGISGLLPFLKKSCRPCKIDEFYGQTVAVDACCWLHRGAFGCAEKLVKNEKTDFYIQYCLKYVKMLLSHRIHVILVFDGASLPAKKQTDAERKERRQSMKIKGKRLLAEGKTAEARDCFKQCTEITFEMVTNLIKACSSLPNVDCIVAPYESDAQLAYFASSKIAQLIITEDSDLIVFGCAKILFKMDHGGHGNLYERANLHLSLSLTEEKFDFVKFRRSCILSGCDYLAGLEGIGLVKAFKFFNKTSQTDLYRVLPKISSYLLMPKLNVDKSFIDKFIEAENTFLYQIIFDVCSSRAAPLNPYPENFLNPSDDLPFAGKIHEDGLAYQLALGNVYSYSHEKVNDFDPISDRTKLSLRSIWHPNYDRERPLTVCAEAQSSSKNDSKQISAFGTMPSRVVIKVKSPKKVLDSKEPNTFCDSIQLDKRSNENIPVVSRFFVNNFSKSKLSETISRSANDSSSAVDKPSALDLLEEMGDDDGARLSKSIVTSPLSVFESPSVRLVDGPKGNLSSPEIRLPVTEAMSASPVLERRKRSFVASPSTKVEETRRSLRTFFSVSPRKLFECGKFQKLPASNAKSPVSSKFETDSESPIVSTCSSSASVASSWDSGVERNESYETESVVDLTVDDDETDSGVHFVNYKNSGKSPLESSKFIGKCKPVGLRKTKSAAKYITDLKQTSIKEMFSAFAYKKT